MLFDISNSFRFENDFFFVFRMTVLSALVLTNISDLAQLANTEARIILLYSTRGEAREILSEATRLKLTGQYEHPHKLQRLQF